jgi:hypothetical protein
MRMLHPYSMALITYYLSKLGSVTLHAFLSTTPFHLTMNATDLTSSSTLLNDSYGNLSSLIFSNSTFLIISIVTFDFFVDSFSLIPSAVFFIFPSYLAHILDKIVWIMLIFFFVLDLSDFPSAIYSLMSLYLSLILSSLMVFCLEILFSKA